jgi:hypothetical protein
MKRCERHVSTDKLYQNGGYETLMTDWWNITSHFNIYKRWQHWTFSARSAGVGHVPQSWNISLDAEEVYLAYNIVIMHI